MKKIALITDGWKRYVTYAWVEGYRRFASVLRQNCPVGFHMYALWWRRVCMCRS